MANSRELKIVVVGDASKLNKTFAQASKSSDKLGKSMMSLGRVAAVGLGAVGVGAAIAGKKMISMASDAAEVRSKMEVVFGKTLPGLTRNLDAFSKATGASRFELREQAADMGALLAPLVGSKKGAADMSAQFVKLATDLGSFNNVPTDEALLAIRSGLVGEAEPLRRFGVLLNEAAVKAEGLRLKLVKGKEEMTEQQKVQARASLIMKQTTLAQGDATRTADSFANQIKRLKNSVKDAGTQIGVSLLPLASKVVGALNTAATGVTNFIGKLSKAEGLKAKVQVVLEGAEAAGKKAIAIGQKLATQIGEQLSKVQWGAVGVKIAGGLGDAIGKGLPVAGKLAGVIAAGFLIAVKQVNWVTVGRAIGEGIKKGTTEGAKEFIKQGGQELIRNATNPMEFAARKLGKDVGDSFTSAFGRSSKTGLITEKQVAAAAMKQGWDPAIANMVLSGKRIGKGLADGTAAGIVSNSKTARDAAARSGHSIGASLGAGVAEGIASQLGYAAAAAEHLVIRAEQAARAAADSHSPSVLMMKVGQDFSAGFVQGMDGGLALLQPKLQAKIKAAVARAQAVVDAAKSRMQASFSLLSDKLLRAFDAETGGHRTASEKIIDQINLQRQTEDMQQAVTDAQKAYDDALKGTDGVVDQDAVAAAWRALYRAREDIQLASLERQAATERQAYDDQRDSQREKLEERLRILGKHFEDEGTTVKTAMAKINGIMKSFGITFAESGSLIGQQFVAGLINAIGGAAAGAGGVRGARTGGDPTPDRPIVIQTVLDGKVVAESVRRNNVVYQTQNVGVRAI